MKPTLYTIHCPQCRVLEAKLNQKHIDYEIITDVEEMREMGIKSAPALEVDGQILNFSQAIKWVREQNENEY